MRSIERRPQGHHSRSTQSAVSWGIVASVGECVPQRSNVGPKARDAGRPPGCRVLADLRRAQGVGAGVAHRLIVRGCDA
jgi:hypothetical protein